MELKTNLGIIKIKAANKPNLRLILKRSKGNTILAIAQKKPISYPYKYTAKKGSRANVKVSVKISDSSPIYGISKLLGLFQ